jgi:3-dehydroquinate dehydratase/shikimate dehydrogenase
VIANPVMHSKSPWIHNPALTAVGLNAVYIPIQVDDLSIFFELIPLLDIRGASVTVPHKSAVRTFLVAEDASVAAVGACNTIYPKKGGFHGANTDVPGFIAPLTAYVSRDKIGSMAVTVVGAGGTSRAAVYALRSLGASVLIVNRTPEKAETLAQEFGCEWAPLAESSAAAIAHHNDLIVQTTSAGMHPNEELDPIEFYELTGREIVYDVIYAPPVTRLLSRAKRAGCRTLNGWPMLLEQAYLQFELFTGRKYPDECRNIALNEP